MTLRQYLDHYGQAHRHPVNRACHAVGIPCIIASLVWLAVSGMRGSAAGPWPWMIFGVGWLFQFIGHAAERTWPEFMKNPIYLFIGPIYFVDKLFNKHRS